MYNLFSRSRMDFFEMESDFFFHNREIWMTEESIFFMPSFKLHSILSIEISWNSIKFAVMRPDQRWCFKLQKKFFSVGLSFISSF